MSDMIIHTNIDIDSTAAEAWSLFGEGFADWATWAPGIDHSALEGPLAQHVVRVNQTTTLGTVRQELVRFDRDERALAYEMTDNLPSFFTRVRNDWVIVPLAPNRCRLKGEAIFVLTDEAEPMRPKLQGKMGMAMEVFAKAFSEQLQSKPQ
ncbi:MAG: hypothetical protein ACI9OJ_003690 [Myxococcota bacterium]|jgi:hypothetical protein